MASPKALGNELHKYFFENDDLINRVAVRVLAGHYWAKYRNFDAFPDKYKEVEDWKAAEKDLENLYSGKPLKEIIHIMVNNQADVIHLRRRKERIPDPPNSYKRDNWEAKRYIAYLFFEEILYECIKKKICPDFNINVKSQEIINLLRSLTIEEYCRIKAYIYFLDDQEKNGCQAYYKDEFNYHNAMSFLDTAFQNCKCGQNVPIQNIEWLKDSNIDAIREAKRNTQNRIGPIPEGIIGKFVNEFYPFINRLLTNSHSKEETIKILSKIVDKSNTKIVNVVEFMLKCMIASHVSDDEYNEIRVEVGKNKKRKRPQVKPLFS